MNNSDGRGLTTWDDIEVTAELSARVTKLEAWVEAFMRTLSGMQVEPVLNELEEAQRAATRRKADDTHLHNAEMS